MRPRLPIPARALWRFLLVGALVVPAMLLMSVVHAATTSIKVNFQNAAAAVPAGYVRDFGEPYGLRSGANQGSGLTYGWVVPGSNTPLDLSVGGTSNLGNGRDRNTKQADQRLDTLMHMQANDITGAFDGVKSEGAWEIEVPNGTYGVTVAVGDSLSSNGTQKNVVRVEGVVAFQPPFIASGSNGTATRNKTSYVTATVSDGRLTLDAVGGFNTKIDYVDIDSISAGDPQRPAVAGVTPGDGATNVDRNVGVLATVHVPNGGINYDTLTPNTVRLTRLSDGAPVAFTSNSSGGGDVIAIQPTDYLVPSTAYRFDVTDGLKDAAGLSFIPFSSTFTTGTNGGPIGASSNIIFQQVKGVATASNTLFSSLTIGPDGKLYVATLTGEIMRYTINPSDGSLSGAQTISTVTTAAGGPRAIIGIVFDPAATANNLILWISNNGPYVQDNAPDWTGKISRLSGPNLETIQDYVVNLPHSFKDHMANSLAFGPDGKLYEPVGSNSAMGAPDAAWGQRPERLMGGAVLRIDPAAITNPPLDIKTEDGGSYNPFAAGAPVSLYATGVRNAYDLVWHSNGQLYLPTNGSAAGGNTPSIPATLPASCASRVNGQAYTGPSGLTGPTNVQTQKDWLFRVVQGGYYGGPNPLRCEWVMNGGNPTADPDPAQVDEYPVGTQPDPNWRGFAYDFGLNKSPDGAIEYRSSTFGGALQGKLLVARYSLSDDIIVLTPGDASNNYNIVSTQEGLPGLTGFNNPLDVTENRANGNLYVVEFGPPSKITLLRPLVGLVPQIAVTPDRIVSTAVSRSGNDDIQTVTIQNTGSADLAISGISIVGTDATQFKIVGTPPTSVAVGGTASLQVAFRPTSTGPKGALLQIASNASNAPQSEVTLRGLSTQGIGGANEPSLQWILDTYQIPVRVGDDDPTTAVIHSDPTQQRAALLGDEVSIQQFERVDNANAVLVEPLAIFGPTDVDPVTRFGWYVSGKPATTSELFSVTNAPAKNGQRLDPVLNAGATLNFDPGINRFGFFSSWPSFADRSVWSEDALNTFTGAIPHHVRVYPLKDSSGTVVPHAYIVASEENTSGFDYQDVVVIVRNVKLAGSAVGATPFAKIYLPIVKQTSTLANALTAEEEALRKPGTLFINR